MTQVLVAPETSTNIIDKTFEALKANQFKVGNTTVTQRKKKLTKLLQAVVKYRPQIKEAMYNDFKKHPSEVDMTEIYPITSEIKYVRSQLHKWMRNQKAKTPMALLGSSSYVKYEPKGVVLIISPWNFPFNLTFGPLITAIAAGNTVLLKPSEYTSHASALMKKIVEEVFDKNEVSLVEGGIETSQKLLSLPFNHIFFTGAPKVGKIVMAAAAKHLTSVTLELGGKSPTIVDASANLDMAARRIANGKFVNNGQICIAPDYVYVHESVADKFQEKLQQYIKKFYSDDIQNESSYSRMVNKRHYDRVQALVEDAYQREAKIQSVNNPDAADNFISPTIITGADDSSEVMTQEIFGPVLPIITYSNLDTVIEKINSKEKPLALYIYSKHRKNINKILNNTRAGGGCINHTGVHFYNKNLPFGGSNNSGIGKGHGWYGFQAFSNARGILKQNMPNALDMLSPPYTGFKQKLIDFTVKWL